VAKDLDSRKPSRGPLPTFLEGEHGFATLLAFAPDDLHLIICGSPLLKGIPG
jgi:hypothetical protein